MSEQAPIDLPLTGTKLSRFSIDGEAYLGFTRTEPELWSAELRAGGPIDLVLDGVASRLSAEEPASLSPLLALVNRHVVSAKVSNAGAFLVAMDDGSELSVPSTTEFESWQYSDDDKRHLVCLAGGRVSQW